MLREVKEQRITYKGPMTQMAMSLLSEIVVIIFKML